MEITVFPPFGLTVAAVDLITASGGQLRISTRDGRVAFQAAPAREGDQVYGCPGLHIALEPGLAARLRGATLDRAESTEQLRFGLGEPTIAESRTSTSPSPTQPHSRRARRHPPGRRQGRPVSPVPQPASSRAA